ncbi:MAG: hypothetical protein KGH94_01700 [Candidatus Micrarchaeota archaeon]|nr:hypothetical protein [Candidatus Micrarchaeota archaeon]
MIAVKGAPAASQEDRYTLVSDSVKLTSMMKRFESFVNKAVTDIYGEEAGRKFSVYSAGWERKLHLVLKEVEFNAKRCRDFPLSELFSPGGMLWQKIKSTAAEKGFELIDDIKMGFQDAETKTSFLIHVPGTGLLRT